MFTKRLMRRTWLSGAMVFLSEANSRGIWLLSAHVMCFIIRHGLRAIYGLQITPIILVFQGAVQIIKEKIWVKIYEIN